jgi:hypothetical protein
VKALAWFGLLAAPAAWTLLLVSGYAIEEAACAARPPVLDSDAAVPLTGGIGLVAIAIATAAVTAALLSWLRLRRDGPPDPRGRYEFTAGAAVVSSIVFLTVILMTATAVVPFDACRPG